MDSVPEVDDGNPDMSKASASHRGLSGEDGVRVPSERAAEMQQKEAQGTWRRSVAGV